MSEPEKCLTIKGFYGNKNKRKWIGLENAINSVVKKHQREKIPKSFPSRILGPTSTWQIFYRQQEAFQYTKSTAKDLHVFAFESEMFEGNTGQRLYLVASYPVFWHYYSQLDEEKRLHYEVIPEGAVCKLYFDLEYDKTQNPSCDGDNMVEIFIQYVCKAIQAAFSVTCSRKDILDLQASTERKFSRHLIFQMKKAVFKDNINAGRFVCSLMSRLVENVQTLHKTATNNETVKIDMSDEHTHAQNKARTKTETSVEVCNENDDDKNVFNKTDGETKDLIDSSDIVAVNSSSNHDADENKDHTKAKDKQEETVDKLKEVIESFEVEDLQKLIVKNKNGDDVLFCDTGVYTKNRNFRLFLSSKLGKKNPLVVAPQNELFTKGDSHESKLENIFHDSLVANVEYCSSKKILTFDDDNLSSNMIGLPGRKQGKSTHEPECIEGYSKSPYPEVDEYITSIITQDSGKGVIRHWTYFHQGELLVYEIAKYRYCHNISRQHRSNNIMLVVDLHKGVWYQKCHDPDCHQQNYKSPEWQLPRNLLPASYFDDDLDLEMDDDELLNTTAELEKQYMEQQANISELDDGADDDLVAAVTTLESDTIGENG